MVTHEELCKSGKIHGSQYDRRKLPGRVWNPILTSPRDGTPVIVAKFGKNEIGEDCGFWWISKGHFDAERQCWHDGIERLSWPTHWMPVAYPALEGQEEMLKEDDATKARRYAIELHDLKHAICEAYCQIECNKCDLSQGASPHEVLYNAGVQRDMDIIKQCCGDFL
jgi:hypothetical protein